MKKLTLILALAILLAGGAVAAMSAPAQAQYSQYGYNYPPPAADRYAQPWVGSNTPWVYYNGDWFVQGLLYYFFGPQYGWAPYYSYPPTYIERPYNWYEPKWQTWYQRNPQLLAKFPAAVSLLAHPKVSIMTAISERHRAGDLDGRKDTVALP